MDQSTFLAPGVRRLTVNIDQDDVELFEGLWAVPDGVALHSYLVQGTKTVLIDPWDAGGYGPEELGVDLADLGLDWKAVDAVATTKPLSPGLADKIREFHPGIAFWGSPADAPGGSQGHEVGPGLSLEVRGGFWFLSSGVLFSGDAFGGLGWVEDEVWAEDVKEDEARFFDAEALRWFSTRALNPEVPEGVKVILPAHGLGTRQPATFVARAQKFGSWAGPDALDEVTVVWPDGANEGADALVGGALDAGVGLNLFRVPGDERSAVAAGARRASLVVVAEGLDDGFLVGLNKDVWRPKVTTDPAVLRQGLRDRV